MNEIKTVKMTAEEQTLFDGICWDLNKLARMDNRNDHLEKMAEIAESLFKRDAIPKVRIAYFTDPSMYVGGNGKSRQEVFERNGTSGRDILRHHDFMGYLRYFICGPDLPSDTIRGFCQIIEDDVGTSGMVLDQIKAYVRKEVRSKDLAPNQAANEFFKLAHEIGVPALAESVRSAAKSVRNK